MRPQSITNLLLTNTQKIANNRNMSVRDSITNVREFLATGKWSKNRLAAAAGMGESVLRNIDDPEWNPTATTLEKLECAISKSLTQGGSDKKNNAT